MDSTHRASRGTAIGGDLLAFDAFLTRMKRRRDATVRVMHEAITSQVPFSAELESVHGIDLVARLHHSTRLMIEKSTTGEPISESELQYYFEIGREDGLALLPLDDLRASFQVSYLSGLREVLSGADAASYPELLQLASYGSREHPRLIEAAELGWAAAHKATGDREEARQFLLQRLLDGAPALTAAQHAGVVLASAYRILLCRPQQPEGVSLAVKRAEVGRVFAAFPGALWRGDPAQGRFLVLLPSDGGPGPTPGTTADLITILEKIVGQRLHAVEAHAPTVEAVPTAFAEVQQMITLIAAIPDAQSRPYRTDELLIELAVVRQPLLQMRLAELLTPLRQGTDLIHTLEVLFDRGLDREDTAKALYIHRRTLTYRLQRIRELTGIDPSTAHGIQLLRTALTATNLPTGVRLTRPLRPTDLSPSG